MTELSLQHAPPQIREIDCVKRLSLREPDLPELLIPKRLARDCQRQSRLRLLKS